MNDEVNQAPGQQAWHVAHVKPRCEKKVAEYCAANHLFCDLPLREETKIYQRRKVTVRKPVFPGYCFLRHTPVQRVTLLKSNLIVRLIPVADQERLASDLEQIHQALDVDPTLDACAAFKAGKRVVIRSGPFRGLEGVVQVVRAKTRVILNVEMIGRGLAVEVEMSLLEPAE